MVGARFFKSRSAIYGSNLELGVGKIQIALHHMTLPPTWTCVLPVTTMGQSKMMPQDPLNHDWKERISTISIKTHFVVLGECKVTLVSEKV